MVLIRLVLVKYNIQKSQHDERLSVCEIESRLAKYPNNCHSREALRAKNSKRIDLHTLVGNLIPPTYNSTHVRIKQTLRNT